MAYQASGVFGELRRGYQVVARLGVWRLDELGRCDTEASDVNTFWLDQPGPLALWLKMGKRFWVWREAEVLDMGSPFVIRVTGSPDVRD